MNYKLKACPFCGMKPKIEKNKVIHITKRCLVGDIEVIGRDVDEAIHMWNHREISLLSDAVDYVGILKSNLHKDDFEKLHPTFLGSVIQSMEEGARDYSQSTETVHLKRIVMAMDVDEISRVANEKIEADQKLNGMEIEHEILPAHTRFILEAIKEELP